MTNLYKFLFVVKLEAKTVIEKIFSRTPYTYDTKMVRFFARPYKNLFSGKFKFCEKFCVSKSIQAGKVLNFHNKAIKLKFSYKISTNNKE